MSAEGDRIYDLPDPELRAFDRGVGTLSVNGEVKGHIASVIGEMKFPSRQPWPWFVIVWADGTKEGPFEDYGPGWYTVRELDAGYLDHFGPSVPGQKRFLWMTFHFSQSGPPCVYDFVWLPADEAAEKWAELGLVDGDF